MLLLLIILLSKCKQRVTKVIGIGIFIILQPEYACALPHTCAASLLFSQLQRLVCVCVCARARVCRQERVGVECGSIRVCRLWLNSHDSTPRIEDSISIDASI